MLVRNYFLLLILTSFSLSAQSIDKIEAVLEKPIPIAIVLIAGGIVLLFVDRFFKRPRILKEENISIQKAIIIEFWQCLAMMPGTSRSAASIIGGMQQGLSRKLAAEFSFSASCCYLIREINNICVLQSAIFQCSFQLLLI